VTKVHGRPDTFGMSHGLCRLRVRAGPGDPLLRRFPTQSVDRRVAFWYLLERRRSGQRIRTFTSHQSGIRITRKGRQEHL